MEFEQLDNIPNQVSQQPPVASAYTVEQNTVQQDNNLGPEAPCFVQNYKAPKTRKKGKGKKIAKVLLCSLLVIVLIIGSCAATAMYMNRLWEEKTSAYYISANKAIADLREELEQNQGSNSHDSSSVLPPASGPMTPAQVYEKNVRAVVAIANQGLSTNIFGQTSETASSGTGFIISEDGYVVSNYHVISGASVLTVMTSDGKGYNATVVGFDETNDVALLKIEATGLPYATFGSSDSLVVGDQVAAIGNPLGELTSSLTVGFISAKDRRINTDGTSMNMIQTDAAINSGNSGGPLFNMNGEVIGITTAKYTGTSNSGATIEGIGFAIPIDDVKDLISDLRQFGTVKSGYLGVLVQDVAQVDADRYGLPLGALIIEVIEGGCAEKAGILPRDIIVDIGGHKVESLSDLTRVLRQFEGGEETVVTVYRGGAEKALSITLDTKPAE